MYKNSVILILISVSPYGPETGSACIRAGFSPRGSNAGDNELTRCREPWIRSDSC